MSENENTIYKISKGGTTACIAQTGAELVSLINNGIEYMWQGDAAYWTGHAPVLFPFVGRLTEDAYIYEGSRYDMTRHGFARRNKFTPVEEGDGLIELSFAGNDETYKNYPFRFVLKIRYELNDDGILTVSYSVDNTDDKTIFFGFGLHPGFNVPLTDNEEFSDYYLDMGDCHTPTRIGFSEAIFLNGKDELYPLTDGTLPLSHSLFDCDTICFKDMATTVSLRSRKSEHGITMSYPDMTFLALWHKPFTEAPYVCIEPWATLPFRQDIVEQIEYKNDMVRLKAGCTYTNSLTLRTF